MLILCIYGPSIYKLNIAKFIFWLHVIALLQMAYLLNTLLNLSAGLHKIHRRNSKTTMIRVHVPETKSSIYKGLKVCLQWKVHLAYPASLRALHSNT